MNSFDTKSKQVLDAAAIGSGPQSPGGASGYSRGVETGAGAPAREGGAAEATLHVPAWCASCQQTLRIETF